MNIFNTLEGGATITLRSERSFPRGFTFKTAHDGRPTSAHDLKAHYSMDRGEVKVGTLVEVMIESDDRETLINLQSLPLGSFRGMHMSKPLSDRITMIATFPDGSSAILEQGAIVSRITARGDGSVMSCLMHFSENEFINRKEMH